jgi:hypothetical protein
VKTVKIKKIPILKKFFGFTRPYLLFKNKNKKNIIKANVVGNNKKLLEIFPFSNSIILR